MMHAHQCAKSEGRIAYYLINLPVFNKPTFFNAQKTSNVRKKAFQ